MKLYRAIVENTYSLWRYLVYATDKKDVIATFKKDGSINRDSEIISINKVKLSNVIYGDTVVVREGSEDNE